MKGKEEQTNKEGKTEQVKENAQRKEGNKGRKKEQTNMNK